MPKKSVQIKTSKSAPTISLSKPFSIKYRGIMHLNAILNVIAYLDVFIVYYVLIIY